MFLLKLNKWMTYSKTKFGVTTSFHMPLFEDGLLLPLTSLFCFLFFSIGKENHIWWRQLIEVIIKEHATELFRFSLFSSIHTRALTIAKLLIYNVSFMVHSNIFPYIYLGLSTREAYRFIRKSNLTSGD